MVKKDPRLAKLKQGRARFKPLRASQRRAKVLVRRRILSMPEGAVMIPTSEEGFMGQRLQWFPLQTGICNTILNPNDVMCVSRGGFYLASFNR